jgi:hypothetical protein
MGHIAGESQSMCPVDGTARCPSSRHPMSRSAEYMGLGAQLVDGSLGMAYGVTSTTLLPALGTNPAAAPDATRWVLYAAIYATWAAAVAYSTKQHLGNREQALLLRGRW